MTIAIFRKILFKNVIRFFNVQRTGKNCKTKKNTGLNEQNKFKNKTAQN